MFENSVPNVSGLNHGNDVDSTVVNDVTNDDPQQRELLRVCRIGRAQGIKGEVNVWAFTDEPELRFAPGAVLADSAGHEYHIVRSRQFKKRWIILFEGIADRNAAEALNGIELFCDADDPDEMEDEEAWYPSDLIGLEVRLDPGFCERNHCDGTVTIAKVGDVLDGAAQSLLELKSIAASDANADANEHANEHEPMSVLVPFVEAIVPEIDLEHGYVSIDPPSGLLPDAMLDVAKKS
ncbi:MAG: ribosome maturation factor RimM [Bifidobacterium sp.]|uniref:Ribosome maturation factor RimM n=1 Tax=Bifidobacterium fermentum TaxID=3059035 RepID=A0AB39UJJ7_9BIFI